MSLAFERERQMALMAALLSRDGGRSLQALTSSRPAGLQRGLQAYEANAGASAERALAARFPTVQALVGEDSFAALARDFWQTEPPERGDLAEFGSGLPAFIAASGQLADVPYLADAARLDALLAEAERAADAQTESGTLPLLAEADPAHLRIELMPGVALLDSAFPVFSIWHAHQPGEDASRHRDAARESLLALRGEQGVAWRAGWKPNAAAIDAASSRWMSSLLRGEPLSSALAAAGEGFELERWLVQALQSPWLLRVTADAA